MTTNDTPARFADPYGVAGLTLHVLEDRDAWSMPLESASYSELRTLHAGAYPVEPYAVGGRPGGTPEYRVRVASTLRETRYAGSGRTAVERPERAELSTRTGYAWEILEGPREIAGGVAWVTRGDTPAPSAEVARAALAAIAHRETIARVWELEDHADRVNARAELRAEVIREALAGAL